jgi:hypothetical protein
LSSVVGTMQDLGVMACRAAPERSPDAACFDEAVELRSVSRSPLSSPLAGGGALLTQNADGSWDLTEALASEAGADLADLRRAAAELGVPTAERILATLIALYLAERLSRVELRPLKPMLKKAKAWLKGATKGVPAPAGEWEAWAASVLP